MKNVIFRFACDFVVHFFLFVLFMPSFRYVQILFDLVLYLVYRKWHSPFILRDSTFYSHTEPNWFHHHHQQPHHTTTTTASDISIHATVSNFTSRSKLGKKTILVNVYAIMRKLSELFFISNHTVPYWTVCRAFFDLLCKAQRKVTKWNVCKRITMIARACF